ncbi:MAG: hypothetical protein Kow0099_26780 [Candidatus Abyssubacteria bacterium]
MCPMETSPSKTLGYYLGRLSEERRERGLVGALAQTSRFFANKMFVTNKATWYRLDVENRALSPQCEAFEFGLMDFLEASDFFEANHHSFSWMFIEQELEVARATAHRFPCLRDGGKVIGYIKFGIERVFVNDFGQVMAIPPDAAFIYDTFIMPTHRSEGLAKYLISRTVDFAKENGFRCVWCHIPAWNKPSISAFTHAGFEAVGKVRYLRVLRKEFLLKRPRNSAFLVMGPANGSSVLQLRDCVIR